MPHFKFKLPRNITSEITYALFDNQIVNETIGTPLLSEFFTILLAVTTLIIGSHASITQPKNAVDPTLQHEYFDASDKDAKIKEDTLKEAQVTWSMVIVLPCMAAAALTGMYYYATKCNNGKLESYMGKYLILMSFVASHFLANYIYTVISRNVAYKFGLNSNVLNERFTISLSRDFPPHPTGLDTSTFELPDTTKREKIIKEETIMAKRLNISIEDQIANYYISSAQIFATLFSIIFTSVYYYYNGISNWILNNIFGLMVVSMGITQTRLPDFKISSMFLILFFIYDIYFVFKTEMMLTVATKVEIPAKFIIPNFVSRSTEQIKMSILGLGDVALPGSFISLCLRFDLYKFHHLNPDSEFHYLQPFKKTYYYASLIGYIIGLIITVRFVHWSGKGQPALLYLVPCLLISVFSTACYLGDVQMIWNYTESVEDANDEDVEETVTDPVCSPETLFLAGEIAPTDEDDKNDKDYVYQTAQAIEEEYIPEKESNETDLWW